MQIPRPRLFVIAVLSLSLATSLLAWRGVPDFLKGHKGPVYSSVTPNLVSMTEDGRLTLQGTAPQGQDILWQKAGGGDMAVHPDTDGQWQLDVPSSILPETGLKFLSPAVPGKTLLLLRGNPATALLFSDDGLVLLPSTPAATVPRLRLLRLNDTEQGTFFAGDAPAGVRILAYLDGQLQGISTSDARGLWTLPMTNDLNDGNDHTLRLDSLSADGAVQNRLVMQLPPALIRPAVSSPDKKETTTGDIDVQRMKGGWRVVTPNAITLVWPSAGSADVPGALLPGQILPDTTP
jgi:hypothetical protein